MTKYDPRFRNSSGQFEKDDWTAISDVGKSFGNQILTLETYLQVEAQYVMAARLFLAHHGCREFVVGDLEQGIELQGLSRDDCRFVGLELPSPYEREIWGVDRIDVLIRACLRELLWCNLLGNDKPCSVHFGRDYYMYFCPGAMSADLKAQIEAIGLFVWQKPRT